MNTPCISAFQVFLDDPTEIDASNRALSLIQETYQQNYYNSSISHHHFVRTAPDEIQDTLSEFVWSNSTLKQVRTKFEMRPANRTTLDAGGGITVIKDVFDEIFLMRPEFDLLDDKKVHYDGNLKIPGICTIRALTYLSGKDATLLALTSQQNYTTRNQTSIVLDFDRELHYVSLNNPNQAPIHPEGTQTPEPRVMIKSALHVVLPGTHPLIAYLRIILHRIMVFAARTFRRAFESKSQSQSPSSSQSNLWMMAIDNLMRSMNKIHMILPLLLIGIPMGAIFLAPIFYPLQLFPYIAFIIARCFFFTDPIAQFSTFWLPVCMASALSGTLVYGSKSFGASMTKTMPIKKSAGPSFPSFPPNPFGVSEFCLIVSHIAWVGVCLYVEANASMVNQILLAPWQQVLNLDDII